MMIGRFPEAEENIAKSASLSYVYARDCIKGRFIAGEEAIKNDSAVFELYKRDVLKSPKMQKRVRTNPSSVQSVLFSRNLWTIRNAKMWLRKHSLKTPTPDITENYYRFRQFRPDGDRYRTIPFGQKTGIKAIIAFE
jgi:hypothetical protein